MARRKKADLLATMSVAELKQLAATKEELEKLEAQKARLSKNLAQVEKAIARLMGGVSVRPAARKKVARKKAGRKKVAKKAPGKRMAKATTRKKAVRVGKKATAKKTLRAAKRRVAKKAAAAKAPKQTLESVVVGLLKAAKGSMAFQDILGTIQKKKLVKSKSANFSNVLRRTISTSKKIKRTGRGMYNA